MPATPALTYLLPILMLLASNVFMTLAWYGHLKFKEVSLPLSSSRPGASPSSNIAENNIPKRLPYL